MKTEELKEILEKHIAWINGQQNGVRADLRGANLSGADLRDDELRHADLDFSCFPLWCGSLEAHIDDTLATQLLYHLIYSVQYSKNTSAEIKNLLCTDELILQANKFHRVNQCGMLEK